MTHLVVRGGGGGGGGPGSQFFSLESHPTISWKNQYLQWASSFYIQQIILLTHCSRETRKRVLGNSADPDQTPQNAASDQGLHCLQIV